MYSKSFIISLCYFSSFPRADKADKTHFLPTVVGSVETI